MPLGVNLTSLTKALGCAKYDDADLLNLVYEAKSELSFLVGLFFIRVVFVTHHVDRFVIYESDAEKKNIHIDSDCIADYDMKLSDIDFDTLGIPETKYELRVTMASSEFSRIVRDLSQLGDNFCIEVSRYVLLILVLGFLNPL